MPSTNQIEMKTVPYICVAMPEKKPFDEVAPKTVKNHPSGPNFDDQQGLSPTS